MKKGLNEKKIIIFKENYEKENDELKVVDVVENRLINNEGDFSIIENVL